MALKWQNNNTNNIQNGCAFKWCSNLGEVGGLNTNEELKSEPAKMKTKGKCMRWFVILFDQIRNVYYLFFKIKLLII